MELKLRFLGVGDAWLALVAGGTHNMTGYAGLGQTKYYTHSLLWELTACAELKSMAWGLLSAMANRPHTNREQTGWS